MAYNKTNWQAGDIVTAEKLNNIEGGVERNDIFVIPVQASSQTVLQGGTEQVPLSLSLQDLNNAYNDGKTLVVEITADYGGGAYIKRKMGNYSATILSGNLLGISCSDTMTTVSTNKLDITGITCMIMSEDDQLVANVTVNIGTVALTE